MLVRKVDRILDYMDEPIIPTVEYVELCKRALSEHRVSGELSMIPNAERLSRVQPDGSAHPMLESIFSMAWDIIEWRREWTDEERVKRWQEVLRLIEDYLAGRWTSTTWRLLIAYELRDSGKAVKGFSITVNRRNGKTQVLSGRPDLRLAIEELVTKLSALQTDEWYLRNVMHLLPERIADLELGSSDVSQHIG